MKEGMGLLERFRPVSIAAGTFPNVFVFIRVNYELSYFVLLQLIAPAIQVCNE